MDVLEMIDILRNVDGFVIVRTDREPGHNRKVVTPEQFREIGDRMEDMEAALTERFSSRMEWISVEDRLPKEKDVVLASTMDKDICFAFLGDDGNLYNSNGFLELGITHWMPLPEPPKPKEPTFKDVFLGKFPKAATNDKGDPKACRALIFGEGRCHHDNCNECWNQPYFEEEEGRK